MNILDIQYHIVTHYHIGYWILDIGYPISNIGYPVRSPAPRITFSSPYQPLSHTNAYMREKKETLGRTITFDTYIKIEK